MLRFLTLLGLQFLLNFVLLGAGAVVPHPVHHDDYTILSARLSDYSVIGPRPLAYLVIAVLGSLGRGVTYGTQNVLVVGCVFLCLRFAELMLRNGRPLPTAGFIAAGAIALAFPSAVDWTKYLGLLTNLSSAVPGLAAMCVAARLDNDPSRTTRLVPAILLLSALSFLAKEDFAVPLAVTALAFALTGNARLWLSIGAAMLAMFGAVLLMNRWVGSVFVSGMSGPDDPYFISLAPLSILRGYGKWLLGGPFQISLMAAVAVVMVAAIAVHRRDLRFAVRLAALGIAPLGLLGPYAILPNHMFAYYAFLPLAMFTALLAGGLYSLRNVDHAR